MTGVSSAQIDLPRIDQASIDSLLARYHLESIKIYVQKLGVISIGDKKIALKRSDFDNRLLITLQKKLSMDYSGFGARFDYDLKDNWLIRGETSENSWGQKSGISLLYQYEY